MIELREVEKRFVGPFGEQTLALGPLSLEAHDGEIVCIVGRSGCGKSTLLRLTAGLIPPSAGEVRVNGEVVKRPSPQIGLVFQEPRLLPWRTVQKNVELGLELFGVAAVHRRARAFEYLRLVGLEGFAHVFPHQLSGGMKQRAAIARALVTEPKVILMDEPFAALDAQTRNEMQTELLRIHQEFQATILFVTHSVDEAVFLADRVVVLSERPGRIVDIIPISMFRPRDRTCGEFNEYRKMVLHLLTKTEKLPYEGSADDLGKGDRI